MKLSFLFGLTLLTQSVIYQSCECEEPTCETSAPAECMKVDDLGDGNCFCSTGTGEEYEFQAPEDPICTITFIPME